MDSEDDIFMRATDPSKQTFAHKLERVVLYIMVFLIGVSMGNFTQQIFNSMQNKKKSLLYNGLYVFAVIIFTILFMWFYDVKIMY